jgi:phasin family protein
MGNVLDRLYEQMAEANKGMVQRVIRLNEIVTRTHNSLAEQQLALVESYLDTGAKQFQALADARDPKGYVSRQQALAAELGERVAAVVQRVVDIQGEVRDELNDFMKEGLRTFEPAGMTKPVREAKPVARESKPAKEGKGSQAAA